MERVWTMTPTKDANKLAVGFDEGTVVIKLGNERPVASLDNNTGKLVWATGHDIQTMAVKGFNKDGDLQVSLYMLLIYTVGVLIHMDWCIRQLRFSSIKFHNITSIIEG